MSFIDKLNWRYAIKRFDSSREVPSDDKQKIFNAIRMAPTSFGIQPFHINVVTDPSVRQELRTNAWDQPQVTDASFLLVFSARTDLSKRVDDFLNVISGGDHSKKELLKSYKEMMIHSFSQMNEEQAKSWTAKQTYIALGFAMAACAELNIDSCPMEGFDSEAFKQVLKLPKEYYPQALLAVGYRADDEIIKPKNRFPLSELFS